MYWLVFLVIEVLWLYLIRHKSWRPLWLGLYILEAASASWSIAEFLNPAATDWNVYFISSVLSLVVIIVTAIMDVCGRKE